VGFLSQVHLSCFLLSYLVAFGIELFQLLRGKSAVSRGVLVSFTLAGMVAHTAYLVNRSMNSGLPPLIGSSHDWLLVLAWLGGLLYIVLLATQQRLAVGLFLLPVMLILVVMAMFVDDTSQDTLRQMAAHRWGMLHAAALVIGMGTVAAATICALMYLLQYQKLRGRSSFLHRLQLPSLETLTSMNHWLVIHTFVMLTVGLVTGFILAAISKDDAGSTFRWTDPVVAGTTFVWVVMVLALSWLLTQKEPSGRQIAKLTFMAGGFLLLTIFGLMMLSGGVHGSSAGPSSNANASSFMEGASPLAEQP
jgi:ABC-type uncharacterized transport system permease subunit